MSKNFAQLSENNLDVIGLVFLHKNLFFTNKFLCCPHQDKRGVLLVNETAG